MRKAVVLCLLAAFLSLPSHAQELSGGRKAVKYSGDALLFAMFARLDCFEPILNRTFEDAHLRKLVVLLRLWVNMLRSGKLITTDIVCFLSKFNLEQQILN